MLMKGFLGLMMASRPAQQGGTFAVAIGVVGTGIAALDVAVVLPFVAGLEGSWQCSRKPLGCISVARAYCGLDWRRRGLLELPKARHSHLLSQTGSPDSDLDDLTGRQ